MGDYLANLVARNLEVADRVEPRIASAFEPAAGLQTQQPLQEDPAAGEPIEEDVLIERSHESSQAMTVTSVPHLPVTVPPRGTGRSERDRVPAQSPASRKQASGAINVDALADRPRAAATASGMLPIVASPSSDNKGIESGVPSRPAAASPTRGSRPDAHHSHTDAERPAAAPPVRAGQSKALDPRPRVLADTVAAPASRRNEIVTVEGDPSTGASVAHPATHARQRSREVTPLEQPTASNTAEPLPPRPVAGRPPLTSASSLAARPVRAQSGPSSVAVRAQLRSSTAARTSALDVPALGGLAESTGSIGSTAGATVHVTIGRLEVKATSTQSPATPRSQAPASSSLDDYLRRRTDGSGQ